MGGGAAMRAVAKVAGIGGLNGGFRGGENPVAAAARKATCSVASVVASSSSDELKQTVANNTNGKANCVSQKPCVEIDDWEFAGGLDELFMGAGEPMPRVVFGGAPTIQEAKQATSDLNDALEKAYLSPGTTDKPTGSLASAETCGLLLLSDSEHVENKPCVVSEKSMSHSAPNHAIQAFRLLHENPAAQTVVASIACDPNVWTAVMQNEALVDFLQSHQTTSVAFSDMDPTANDSFEAAKWTESEKPEASKGFMGYVDDIKQKITDAVVDMVNSLSDTFNGLFGGSVKPEYSVSPDGSAGISVEKATIGASLMGLAVMVILMVVLKRT